MGYTHYYTHTEVPQEVWDGIVSDCKRLEEALPDEIPITGWDGGGDRDPIFDKYNIVFNGVGDDAHESFNLSSTPTNQFACTKTAYKPYDLLVCACLIVYKVRSPETMELSSDGDWEDWQEAVAFVDQVIGGDVALTFKMMMMEEMS